MYHRVYHVGVHLPREAERHIYQVVYTRSVYTGKYTQGGIYPGFLKRRRNLCAEKPSGLLEEREETSAQRGLRAP